MEDVAEQFEGYRDGDKAEGDEAEFVALPARR